MLPSLEKPETQPEASSALQVDLRALAEEIVKLLKEELRREEERLGR